MIAAVPRPDRWAVALIAVVTVVMTVMLVRWADREALVVWSSSTVGFQRPVPRPDWILALQHPYRRAQHGWLWVCVATTIGVGGLLACDGRTWTRRRLSRPGTTLVFALILVGGMTAAQQALTRPAPNGLSISLFNALAAWLPGTTVGVWVATGLRPSRCRPDRRERAARMVGWMWMANIGLLIGYGLLFR